jgi:hypothetical protein
MGIKKEHQPFLVGAFLLSFLACFSWGVGFIVVFLFVPCGAFLGLVLAIFSRIALLQRLICSHYQF